MITPGNEKAFAQSNVKMSSVGRMSRTATTTGYREAVFTTDMTDAKIYVREHVINFEMANPRTLIQKVCQKNSASDVQSIEIFSLVKINVFL